MDIFDPNSINFDSNTKNNATIHYVICSIPRSGSTLLVRSLWNTNLAGKPHEYFHQEKHMKEIQKRWEIFNLKEYIKALVIKRKTENGVFGLKAHYYQYAKISEKIDIESICHNIRYIYITRRDKIRQAISLYRACKSKSWAFNEPVIIRPDFDYDQISKSIDVINDEESNWSEYFKLNNINPLRLEYEKFIKNYKKTIFEILKYLGIRIPINLEIGSPPLKKQSDEMTESWVKKILLKNKNKNKIYRCNNSSAQIKTNKIPKIDTDVIEKINNSQFENYKKVTRIEVLNSIPNISVIIFSYNFQRYIGECIESILKQTLRPLEIIICDDHSTDDSYNIIEKYKNDYPRLIKAYKHDKNIGHQRNANFALREAKGDFISRIDGDDRWLPKKLEIEENSLRLNQKFKIAYSNVYTINENGQKTGLWYVDSSIPPSGDVLTQIFSKSFYPNTFNTFRNELVHKEVHQKIGEMDEEINVLIDWDFKIRAAAEFSVIYTKEPLVEYRLHNMGIHNSSPEIRYNDVLKIYCKNKHLLLNISDIEKKQIENGVKSNLRQIIPDKNIDHNFTCEDENILSELGININRQIKNLKQIHKNLIINGNKAVDQFLSSSNIDKSIKIKSKVTKKCRTIDHIINPVLVPKESDLYYTQPITFETMRRAKEFCKKKTDVTLFTAYYQEDKKILPDGFTSSKILKRSILDFGQFNKRRKLPLIVDILNRLYQASDAEYFIYTNVDIALKPNFYTVVNEIINQGYDAFIINRRTIPSKYHKIEDIPLMYKEFGKSHPGYDCFVFRREAFPKFRLRNICVGINYIGQTLFKNLECHSKKFKIFKDLKLTFHIGDEKIWKNDEFEDYRKHNEQEYYKVLDDLKSDFNYPISKSVIPKKNIRKDNYTKISCKQNKFTRVIEKNEFFILSTGRSGTQTIAKSLSKISDCLCLHEPFPQLILESAAYRYGILDGEQLRQFILQIRRTIADGTVYGESNQTYSLIIPVLIAALPRANFIWLIRNGLDVVTSTFSRQWYTGHSANHANYKDCPPIEKAWIDGRIMGDLCSDVPAEKWKIMNPFARCCWYWAFVNRIIEKDLGEYISAGSYRILRLEELDKELPNIAQWLGLGYTNYIKCRKYNEAHYDLYHWKKWSSEERKTFLYWCGPLMDKFYPNWRVQNNQFFETLYNPPQKNKLLIKNLSINQKKTTRGIFQAGRVKRV